MTMRLDIMRHHPLLLTLGLICGLATSAAASVQVEGTPATLRITTDHDAVDQVLAALAATLKVKYRSAIRLETAAHATYSGSLREVIARLLDGYNYVVKRDGPATEIVVFGRRGELAIPPPARSAPPAGILSRWR
jgi:hypothetical protein